MPRFFLRTAAVAAMAPLMQGQASPPQVATAPPVTPRVSAESDDVVVLGMSEKERDRAIGGFVRALTVIPSGSPLPRFDPDVYCPVVFGLKGQRNEEIAGRMRRVAAAAGVRPAAAGCIPSAFVFFVDDRAKFLKAFAARQPVFFGQMATLASRSKGEPTSSWQLTQDITPEKRTITRTSLGGSLNGEVKVVSTFSGGSRLTAMITTAVAAAVVVIERQALIGLSTIQIADHALMRTLVDKAPGTAGDLRKLSVLGVIDAPLGSETPLSLTKWDFAYSKARYDGDARLYAERKYTAMRQSMRHDIAATDLPQAAGREK